MRRRKRRGLRALFLLCALFALLCADSALRLVTTEYEIASRRLPAAFDGYRIVQLSDVHGAEFGAGNRRLLERVAAARPDLVALTGDLADGDTDMAVIDALLAGLTELAPVCYVSGNHEWSERQLPALEVLFAQHGVRYLRNEFLQLRRGGAHIVLCGVEDPNGWQAQPRPDAVAAGMRQAEPDAFAVLLGHRNDFLEKYPALPVDLVLCGHAHGGIVRLPVLGGLLGTGGTFFPDYEAGRYDGDAYTMIVSRGLGGGARIPRFLNNPEVVAVTLRCG